MRKKMITLVALLLAVSCLTGCSIHLHSWKKATCVSPKTCIDCGKVKGKALRHEVSKRGTCAVCGERLNTIFNLSTVALEPPVLYGGICLQLTVVDRSNGAQSTMFPGRYTIYDNKGKIVTDGDWNPFVGADHPVGQYTSFTKDSSFIPLDPGAYSVGFTYYKDYEYDDINKVFIPKGASFAKSRNFVVE